MVRGWVAVGVLLLLVLSSLPSLGTASTGSALVVDLTLTDGSSLPAGVAVDLSSDGTGQNCSAATLGGGNPFVTFGGVPGCILEPGWYSLSVAPQVDSSTNPPWAIFPPSTSAADTFYASASTLSTGGPERFTGIDDELLNQSLRGDVNQTLGSPDPNTAQVEVLDPSVPGLVLASGTAVGGIYDLPFVPPGTWTLYASGLLPGGTELSYNYTMITLPATASGSHWQNVTLGGYRFQGLIVPDDRAGFYNQTNLTLWDTATGQTYEFENPAGQYPSLLSSSFDVGDFNSLVGETSATDQFLLLVAPQGYSTSWTYVDAGPAHESSLAPLSFPVRDLSSSPATTTSTTIAYAGNFSAVNVTSTVTLSNDSTIRDLPNASVGDLFAQVAMDFGSSGAVNATSHAWSSFTTWLNQSGPVYPANEMGLETNSTEFLEQGRYRWSSPFPTPSDLNFNSVSSYSYRTAENYNLSSRQPGVGYSSYSLTVGYAFPAAGESFSYQVDLPPGYTLEAGTPAPAGTDLLPGPGGNFSAFTIVPLRSPTGLTNGTATLTVVRTGSLSVTAVVDVTSPNFAFSNRTNVLNSSHDNYQVLVGLDQNVSFSAAASVLPPGRNASSYAWYFSDGPTQVVSRSPVAWHYYRVGGRWNASLVLTANSGAVSVQHFIVLVDAVPPEPVITTNDTHLAGQGGNTSVLFLNWSQEMHWNATGSKSLIIDQPRSNVTVGGEYLQGGLSVADWEVLGGSRWTSENFTAAAGGNVLDNATFSFHGAGNDSVRTIAIYDGAGQFLGNYHLDGWLYRVVLNLFDAGGLRSEATLWVLVNDTEPPVAIGGVQGGIDFVPSSGIGLNQTSGSAATNNTCSVALDEWSYAPHNGTIAFYDWEVTNPANASFRDLFYNQSTSYRVVEVWLPLPMIVGPTLAPYRLTLTVGDTQGNLGSASYTFSCELGSAPSPSTPLLWVWNITAGSGSTLVDGSRYTVWVNVTNLGGNNSVAQDTVVSFYYEATSGEQRTTIPGPDRWYGFVAGVLNITAAPGSTQNIFFNHTYRAEVSFVPAPGLSRSYEVCANGTAINEPPGYYRSDANLQCTWITLGSPAASGSQDLLLVVLVGVPAGLLLVVVGWVLLARRRRPKREGPGALAESRPAAAPPGAVQDPSPPSLSWPER